ncbi:2-amino-4-hydroxy-6-hydroxymethyldihydropteridine pyrophosphokinase [bioreactor metagenome]|uniref:2-amino-4-hydroxy-6-hydroxymethyldihydropteridine diphosphokinase n=1 Tax=bioreactor metagenome TaxID=1076179 RepID=A0A644VHR7_9ZZZZ|nr:2-amino-4-hydroxy-6-hydroxymethyldihydropteridine diphosphokinase [Acidaminococcaceae bacterium]NLU44240.1 2-amino-4-hydroxy-6-hydroxymethyldihydropteridine diphosphokinase [Acholeplasmataceae bacterium]
MPIAYVALGSNLGNKKENLLQAIELLKNHGVNILAVSSFLVTKPYGVTDQPDFLNGAIKLEYDKSPEELLEVLLAVEQEMGRVRLRHWGERIIDLDLLLFGQEVIETKNLVVPHKDMENREFVLAPLAEIAPQVVLPNRNETIEKLLTNLRKRDGEK